MSCTLVSRLVDEYKSTPPAKDSDVRESELRLFRNPNDITLRTSETNTRPYGRIYIRIRIVRSNALAYFMGSLCQHGSHESNR